LPGRQGGLPRNFQLGYFHLYAQLDRLDDRVQPGIAATLHVRTHRVAERRQARCRYAPIENLDPQQGKPVQQIGAVTLGRAATATLVGVDLLSA
jgi:hypothetical protein